MAYKNFILVCGGTGCESNKGDEIYRALQKEAELQGVKNDVQVVKTGCFGFCEKGPIVKVLPQESFYVEVKPEDAREIIAEQVVKGREVKRLLYKKDKASSDNVKIEDIEFYQKQFRVVLRNCGVINPENIDEYIARDGYSGLEKALFKMTPDQVVEELKTSGLRGRGGAGFPTWMKWDLTKKAAGRREVRRLQRRRGRPGRLHEPLHDRGRSPFHHRGDDHLRKDDRGPARASSTSAPSTPSPSSGSRSPSSRPATTASSARTSSAQASTSTSRSASAPAPSSAARRPPSSSPSRASAACPSRSRPSRRSRASGSKPTVINNVETYANVSVIMAKGADWFAKIGTEKSKGTKTFALTGKINNSGLVEVPMGTTLREIIFDIGGGIRNGKKFKGVQTGGPSGGIITEESLDQPISYESLTALGSMMGSGGMIIMDEDDCVVDIAKFYMAFCCDESCGKCAPCRIGTKQMHGILEKISNGEGSEDDLAKLEKIGKAMTKASLCMLGGSAANPTLSTMRHFREEYMEHIRDHKCSAGKCKNLVVFEIDPAKCIGCGLCARRCPIPCINPARRSSPMSSTGPSASSAASASTRASSAPW